jgi:hypothetical protein
MGCMSKVLWKDVLVHNNVVELCLSSSYMMTPLLSGFLFFLFSKRFKVQF